MSAKDTIEELRAPETVGSKSIKISARYKLVDKVEQYGQYIQDPLAIRALEANNSDEEIVQTAPEDKHKRELAIKKINRTFERIKKIVPGIEKEGSGGKVTAEKVLEFLPFEELMAHDYQMAVFDADPFPDGPTGLLKSFRDLQDRKERLALFSLEESNALTSNNALLGKRTFSQKDIHSSHTYTYKREFAYAVTDSNVAYILHNFGDQIRYVPFMKKLALTKVKKHLSRLVTAGEIDAQLIKQQNENPYVPKEMFIVGRNLTEAEFQSRNKGFDNLGMTQRLAPGDVFEDESEILQAFSGRDKKQI